MQRALIWAGLQVNGMAEEYRPDLLALNHWMEDVSKLAFFDYVEDYAKEWKADEEEIKAHYEGHRNEYTIPARTRAEILGATVSRAFGASEVQDRVARRYLAEALATVAFSPVGKSGLSKVQMGVLDPGAPPRKGVERIMDLLEPDVRDLRFYFKDSVLLTSVDLAGFTREGREKVPELSAGEVLPMILFRVQIRNDPEIELDIEAAALRVLEQIPEKPLPLEAVRNRIVEELRASYIENLYPELERHGYEPLEPKINEDVLQSL
jgi:hypothetical protein